MKSTALLLLGTSLVFVSCTTVDPDYEAYKKQQEANASGQGGLANSTDPYAVQGADPYGVPGTTTTPGSEVGTYTPNAPYQPLPSAPANTPNAIPPRSGFPTIPNTGAAGVTTTHIVAKGDSLWGLSRKYGTSTEAIKQANGMTNDTVILGTTLQIPR